MDIIESDSWRHTSLLLSLLLMNKVPLIDSNCILIIILIINWFICWFILEPSQTQTQNVLTYYGLERNPFSHLMASAHYIDPDYTPPVWFDVNDYSTSRVIFGKRGTGKTSLRLYFKNHLKKNHPKLVFFFFCFCF